MTIRTGLLIIFVNGLLYSHGFFINSRDVRKFFGSIPTIFDNYRREAKNVKSVKFLRQEKKYEDSFNEKLNKFHSHTQEKPKDILNYEDSHKNENLGRYDEVKNHFIHLKRSELERLKYLDEQIKNGKIKLLRVQVAEDDRKKETDYLTVSSPVLYFDSARVNSDDFNSYDDILRPEFQGSTQYGNLFGRETDYFI